MYKYFFFSHKSHLTISNHPQSWDINRDLKNYPSCTGGPEVPIVPVAHVLPTNFINSVHQLGREDHHEDVLQDLLHQQIPPRKNSALQTWLWQIQNPGKWSRNGGFGGGLGVDLSHVRFRGGIMFASCECWNQMPAYWGTQTMDQPQHPLNIPFFSHHWHLSENLLSLHAWYFSMFQQLGKYRNTPR